MDVKRASLRDWVLACTAGELLGFGLAGGLAALAFTAIPDPSSAVDAVVLVAACIAVGLVEGATFGLFQWIVLRRMFPRLGARAWIAASAIAGAAGWFLGALPSTLVALFADPRGTPWDPSIAETVFLASACGVALGALLGAIQWTVLRRHAERARQWIAANAIAWGLALAWSFFVGSIASRSPWLVWGASAAAGIAMGLTVAVITGLFLASLEAGRSAPSHA